MKFSILPLFALFGSAYSAKNFVLRFDDVQDWWIVPAQQAVIQWCMDNNVDISIGVIGGFFGADSRIVNQVRDCLNLGSTRCEVFNHGQDATNRLGDMGSVSQIQALISQAHNVIQNVLGYTPRSFVPHQNSWSSLVTDALNNLEYDVISASMEEGMVFDMGQLPVHMPQQTETAVYVGGTFVGRNVNDIFADCQAADANGDEACVVMMHPQEYDSGQFSTAGLAALVQLFEDNGWTSMTFAEAAAPYIPERPTPPPPPPTPAPVPGPKNYVLRFDDIQDYYIVSSQQEVIQWCMDNDVAISVGVIGGFIGQDNSIVNQINACLALGPNRCEIFNHGKDATYRLGDMASVSEIQALIEESHDIIQDVFGYTPRSFVPHQNSWSSLVTDALNNLEYDVISASMEEGMFFDMGQLPVHMPQQTETAVFLNGGFVGRNVNDIFADCQAARNSGDEACVVMMHPQEYASGEFSTANLAALKQLFDADGWTSMTFGQAAAPFVPQRPTPPPPPPTPAPVPGPKDYVLRFDDVQDYFNGPTQREVIQWVMDNNIDISIGVIGGFFGADSLMVQQVRDCLDLGSSRCEVFNHGLDATYRLGDLGSVQQIQTLIEDSHNLIQNVLQYTCRTFVPHQNSWSVMVTEALRNLNYDVISASPNEGMQFDMTLDPVHMPQQTETAEYIAGGFLGRDPNDVFADCQAARTRGDEACVIMMHPQEYASGQFTLGDLATLKNLLDGDGWTSKTFGEVAAPYVPERPTPSPVTMAPTSPFPEIGLYAQCGSTPNDEYGYNCVAGSFCNYGGQWWSSCTPCSATPSAASQSQYAAKCGGAPNPTPPPPPTASPVVTPTTPPPPTVSPVVAPTSPPQPTGSIPLYGQCGTTPIDSFGYNCVSGAYCNYGGEWWSACTPCNVSPNIASQQQYNANCVR